MPWCVLLYNMSCVIRLVNPFFNYYQGLRCVPTMQRHWICSGLHCAVAGRIAQEPSREDCLLGCDSWNEQPTMQSVHNSDPAQVLARCHDWLAVNQSAYVYIALVSINSSRRTIQRLLCNLCLIYSFVLFLSLKLHRAT